MKTNLKPEIDDLNQPDKGQAKFSFNNSYVTGTILIVIAIISLFIGFSFDDIYFFTLFIGISGIVILVQAFASDAKRKKYNNENIEVLDDKNEII